MVQSPSYDTQPGNEMGLFYNAPKPTRHISSMKQPCMEFNVHNKMANGSLGLSDVVRKQKYEEITETQTTCEVQSSVLCIVFTTMEGKDLWKRCEFYDWSEKPREWQMVRAKVATVMRWCVQDEDWIVQCLTSPPTQYRLYGRRFLQVKRPNQQYRSTEGKSTKDESNNGNNTKQTCIDNNWHE